MEHIQILLKQYSGRIQSSIQISIRGLIYYCGTSVGVAYSSTIAVPSTSSLLAIDLPTLSTKLCSTLSIIYTYTLLNIWNNVYFSYIFFKSSVIIIIITFILIYMMKLISIFLFFHIRFFQYFQITLNIITYIIFKFDEHQYICNFEASIPCQAIVLYSIVGTIFEFFLWLSANFIL